MSTIITRVFESEAQAAEAEAALRRAGFPADMVVVTRPPGDGSGSADAANRALLHVGLAPAAAQAYADRVGKGGIAISVRAPFGHGKLATQVMADHGGADLGHRDALAEKGRKVYSPTPFSSAFDWPVLSHNPTPLSSWLGLKTLSERQTGKAKLLDEPAPLSEKFGIRTLSDDPAPLSRKLGRPVLLEEPAPLSKKVGMSVLSDDPAPLSRKLGLRLLLNDPAPLSRLLHLAVLSHERHHDR